MWSDWQLPASLGGTHPPKVGAHAPSIPEGQSWRVGAQPPPRCVGHPSCDGQASASLGGGHATTCEGGQTPSIAEGHASADGGGHCSSVGGGQGPMPEGQASTALPGTHKSLFPATAAPSPRRGSGAAR